MKALEKFRAKETDPKICMKMLKLYEEIGKQLGPEEVGNKVLPGIIPMLITGQFTKTEFKDIMSSIRRLLDQIEEYRVATLPDTSKTEQLFGASTSQQPTNTKDPFSTSSKTEGDPLAFLTQATNNTQPKNSMSAVDDIFSAINNAPGSKPAA